MVPSWQRETPFCVQALDGRNELHPGGAGFVPEKAVDLEGVISVEPIDGGQDIIFHPMLLQQPQASHHPVKGWLAALVHPVGIMQLPGPVDTDADEKIVLAEELAPVVVQERAVGLHGVLEGHARPLVLVLEINGPPVKIEAHQGGFAALPGHRHLIGAMGLDELPDILFQHLISHAKMTAGVEPLFVQKKAIRAVQVANRPGRLGQYVNAGGQVFSSHAGALGVGKLEAITAVRR